MGSILFNAYAGSLLSRLRRPSHSGRCCFWLLTSPEEGNTIMSDPTGFVGTGRGPATET